MNIEPSNQTPTALNEVNATKSAFEKTNIELIEVIFNGQDNPMQRQIRSKKYKMFSAEKKKICIDEFRNRNGRTIKEIAKKHNIPHYSLKRWAISGPERHKGCGRKVKDPDMDRKLLEWYQIHHDIDHQPVNARLFKEKALAFSSNKAFRASRGWLEKFKKRHRLNF